LQKFKPLRHLKSFRIRLTIGIAFLALVILLFALKFAHKNTSKTQNDTKTDTSSFYSNTNVRTDSIPNDLDLRIDSILFSFGIKKEWITTVYNGNSAPKNSGPKNPVQKEPKNKNVQKKSATDVSRFVKNILIPRDLSSIEVNLDITNYINSIGLIPDVSEDISTKDITVNIRNSADTIKNKIPAARLIINHSDKAVRETGTFVIILNNINEYKKEEIDNILNSTYEFSFIFPRNLDDIEIQNKLIQQKKDVIINLTIGGKDNPETDFNTGFSEKEIKQRVKSFTSDFPSVNTVILTKTDLAAHLPGPVSAIIQEFNIFKIKVIPDSLITSLLNKNEETSNDKVNILINNIKSKGGQTNKNFISVISLSYKEFQNFYNGLSILKKLGYKFYSLTDYLSKEAGKEKREKLKEEKLKEEKLKDNKTQPKEKTSKENTKQTDNTKSKDKTKPNEKK